MQIESSLIRHQHICELLKQCLIERPAGHMYRCCCCFDEFPVIQDFYDHLSVHEKQNEEEPREDYEHFCTICTKRFFDMKHLVRHGKSHEENAGYICIQCPDKKNYFALTSDFKKHLLRHSNYKPVQCDHCEESFLDTYLLKLHVVSRHKDIASKEFVCEWCGLKYSRKDKLRAHVKRVHDNVDYICKVCEGGKSFAYLSDYNKHMQRHNTPETTRKKRNLNRKCETCSKSFRDNWSLQKHIDATHLGIRPFLCDICARSYTDQSKYMIRQNWKML